MEIRLSEFEDYVSPKIVAWGEAYYEEGAGKGETGDYQGIARVCFMGYLQRIWRF